MAKTFGVSQVALILLAWLTPVAPTSATELKSPDGLLLLDFQLRDFEGREGSPVYRVTWKGQGIVAPSRLDLELKDTPFLEKLGLVSASASTHDPFIRSMKYWFLGSGKSSPAVVKDMLQPLTAVSAPPKEWPPFLFF